MSGGDSRDRVRASAPSRLPREPYPANPRQTSRPPCYPRGWHEGARFNFVAWLHGIDFTIYQAIVSVLGDVGCEFENADAVERCIRHVKIPLLRASAPSRLPREPYPANPRQTSRPPCYPRGWHEGARFNFVAWLHGIDFTIYQAIVSVLDTSRLSIVMPRECGGSRCFCFLCLAETAENKRKTWMVGRRHCCPVG